MASHGPRQQAFDEIDDASAALILQMQREDVDELLASSKGKKRKREESDSDLAMAMFRDDLQDMSAVIADRSISRSMTQAVLTDAAFLHESVAEERSAADDRAMAWRLAGRRIRGTDTANTNPGLPALEESLSARLLNQYVAPLMDMDAETSNVPSDGEDGRQTIGDSASWMASFEARAACTLHNCICCDTLIPLFKLLFAPCGHYYCEECLQSLFRLSMSDETLFPPRCCHQHIPLTSAKLYLGSDLIEHFQKKSIEFSTPDRTYCHRQTCSAFIPPQSIEGDRGSCPDCGSSTCRICKSQSHTGDCPQDGATQQVLNLAEEEGWQRCSNCRRLVELHHGCNHITYVPNCLLSAESKRLTYARCICRFEFW